MITSPRAVKRTAAVRRRQRGMTLVIALGVIAVATAATLVSLRIVSQESQLQGRERHTREAFFAAEAGMAEGREVLSGLMVASATKSDILINLGKLRMGQTGFDSTTGWVTETGFPGEFWFEIIPDTRYSLLPARGALAASVTTPQQELRDINGRPYISYPEQASVFYRVFVYNDDDGGSPTADKNQSLWMVSVGEVRGGSGEVLTRSVVRALVYAGAAILPQCESTFTPGAQGPCE